MATEEESFVSNPAHPPGFSRQGNCYTHSPLFFPTMPWAMRYKTRPPAPRVKVDAHTCVLLLFRSCVECGIGTIPSRNAGDRMPRMGIFTVPLTYRFILYKLVLGFARNQGWVGGKRNHEITSCHFCSAMLEPKWRRRRSPLFQIPPTLQVSQGRGIVTPTAHCSFQQCPGP